MKNPPKVNDGDQVRVTIVGEAHRTLEGRHAVGVNRFRLTSDHVVSVEILPPPVEVFGPGDLVRNKANKLVFALARTGFTDLTTGMFTESRYVAAGNFTSKHYDREKLS